MRLVLLLALVLAGCGDATPTDPSVAADLACEGARIAVLYRFKPPAPAPAPAGDVCDNCDGKGKIRSGDGISVFTCPVCKGTGKKTK